MNQYRVLLVDDEEEIRMGIGCKIDWDSLGFELVGEAENGIEALELSEQLHPDVVLTDIKMPFMDGLTLCGHLKTTLPAAKLVIFSGFDDFEYARQAIGINVSDYILKPINAAELSQVLTKIRQQLDNQRAEQQNMDLMRRRYEENLPVLRELFYTRLLDGWIKPEQVHLRASRYEIDLPEGYWVASLIRVSCPKHTTELSRNELRLLSVLDLFADNFALADYSIRQLVYDDKIALIACMKEDNIYPLIEELDRICALAQSYQRLTLTIGMGRSCNGAEYLAQSLTQARSALEYRVLVGRGQVIYLGDLEPDTSISLDFDETDEWELAGAVKLGSEDDLCSYISGMVARVREAGLAMNQCRLFFWQLTLAMVRLTRSGGIDLEEIFGENFNGSVSLADFSSLEELEEWCCERCMRLQKALGHKRSDSAWRTVEMAKDFINENYGDSNLNVETLCSHLHLSPAYFSTLFKKQTGISFTAYVTKVRMETASKLLRETEDKTYLIAEQTGYMDPNYFSYVFKRHFGISPSKYRSGQAE